MTYVRTLKRIRSDKTNYHKRAAIIIGRNSFVTVKVTGQNVAAQLLKVTKTGDLVLASVHSRELAKQGWKGSFNSLPACYLTGLLLGKKALANGTNGAVLYIGNDRFTSRVAACVKGIVDSGVKVPMSEESLPDADRISGQHIADYASSLKSNQEKYNSRFSALLKNGLSPEDYPSHFEEIRFKISGKALEPRVKKEKAVPKEEKAAKEKKEKAPKREQKGDRRPDKGGKKK